MFPGMPVPQTNKHERKLIKLFKSLDDSNKEMLIVFAEFLQSRNASQEPVLVDEVMSVSAEPLDIPRPESESVVKAIKRLTATYPMVNKEDLLHPISGLMTSHIMQGKRAEEVIDELEILFINEYNKLKNNNKKVK